MSSPSQSRPPAAPAAPAARSPATRPVRALRRGVAPTVVRGASGTPWWGAPGWPAEVERGRRGARQQSGMGWADAVRGGEVVGPDRNFKSTFVPPAGSTPLAPSRRPVGGRVVPRVLSRGVPHRPERPRRRGWTCPRRTGEGRAYSAPTDEGLGKGGLLPLLSDDRELIGAMILIAPFTMPWTLAKAS